MLLIRIWVEVTGLTIIPGIIFLRLVDEDLRLPTVYSR